jgi:hypothetical protein
MSWALASPTRSAPPHPPRQGGEAGGEEHRVEGERVTVFPDG